MKRLAFLSGASIPLWAANFSQASYLAYRHALCRHTISSVLIIGFVLFLVVPATKAGDAVVLNSQAGDYIGGWPRPIVHFG